MPDTQPSPALVARVAGELDVDRRQVDAALRLFGEGATLPFVARYRKEATGGLDEVQLRDVRDRARYLAELEERRAQVLQSVREQGKLTDELRARIERADTKQELEDLYLPYRPKRKTRGVKALERGLGPLADRIWNGEVDDRGAVAAAAEYVDPDRDVPDTEAALRGARDVLAERVADEADVRAWIRSRFRTEGTVRSVAVAGKEEETSKFQDYYDHTEPVTRIPSHRVLALRRGEAEGFLAWTVEGPDDELVEAMQRHYADSRPAREQMTLVVRDAYRRLLMPAVVGEIRVELRDRADADAIDVFGRNLEELLLAAPAGQRPVLGLDPGFRTGVKAAVVSATGALQDTATLYLHRSDAFAAELRGLVARWNPAFVAVGNGTASRETDGAVREALADLPAAERPEVVVVNEAGASVYSASDVARDELPDVDVSLRGAVSIARRLQDPLAELVKIDPKSIGVGQYQHDVNQTRLRERLDDVVTSCVNRVGVELNTASPALLSYVAGLGPTLAGRVVEERDRRGGFRVRGELLDVPRLGEKAFEQCAGFLRIQGGEHPLDRTAVHPERYALVERMASDVGRSLEGLVEDEAAIRRIRPDRYVTGEVGLPTLEDILAELRRPGRDPRDAFEPPAFREDVQEIGDVREGMTLEGVVTNVVAFGAFVDIGVHQDGLVHVSQIADRYVEDPADEVRVGQKVRVRVLSVDVERGRIGLSMKAVAGEAEEGGNGRRRN